MAQHTLASEETAELRSAALTYFKQIDTNAA